MRSSRRLLVWVSVATLSLTGFSSAMGRLRVQSVRVTGDARVPVSREMMGARYKLIKKGTADITINMEGIGNRKVGVEEQDLIVRQEFCGLRPRINREYKEIGRQLVFAPEGLKTVVWSETKETKTHEFGCTEYGSPVAVKKERPSTVRITATGRDGLLIFVRTVGPEAASEALRSFFAR